MSDDERPYRLTVSGSAHDIRVITALADLYLRHGFAASLDSPYPAAEVYSLADALGWFTVAVLEMTESNGFAACLKELWDSAIVERWLDVAAHIEQAAQCIRNGIAALPEPDKRSASAERSE